MGNSFLCASRLAVSQAPALRGERVPAIARSIGCDDEMVRDVIRAFDERGLEALQRASSRPHHIQAAFTPKQAERLREILHTSPREFDKPTHVWILELADRVCAAFGCDHEDHFAVPENAS